MTKELDILIGEWCYRARIAPYQTDMRPALIEALRAADPQIIRRLLQSHGEVIVRVHDVPPERPG